MDAMWGFTVLLQLGCLVHAIKTGRTGAWIYIIIFVPMVGSFAYLVVEVLPSVSPAAYMPAQQIGILDRMFPQRRIKRLEENLQFTDTINNRILLADAYADIGQFDRAIKLLEDCLTGLFKNDPDLNLKMAVVYHRKGDYQRSMEYLDKLKNKKDGFDNYEAWKHSVLNLQQTADERTVREEYKRIMERHNNYEIRHYFASYLRNKGSFEEARSFLEQIIKDKKLVIRDHDRDGRYWVKKAEKSLKELQAQAKKPS